jgi:hypothetical protein
MMRTLKKAKQRNGFVRPNSYRFRISTEERKVGESKISEDFEEISVGIAQVTFPTLQAFTRPTRWSV